MFSHGRHSKTHIQPSLSFLFGSKINLPSRLVGNGGTASGLAKVENVSIGVLDFAGLTKFAIENKVNFVIPGPEQPLVEGVTTAFQKSM